MARIERQLARQVLSGDLTRTEFSVLGALARHGEQRLTELAEREGLNPTMLSRILIALENAGWAERTPDPEDRRAVLTRLTARGQRLHDTLQRDRALLIQQFLDELLEPEVGRLAAAVPLLERLADRFVGLPRPDVRT